MRLTCLLPISGVLIFLATSPLASNPLKGNTFPTTIKTFHKTQPKYDKTKSEINATEKELKRFLKVKKLIVKIQEDRKGEIISLVRKNGFSIDRYRKIIKNLHPEARGAKKKINKKGSNLNLSESELKDFREVNKKVVSIQKSMQLRIKKAMRKNGFKPERYRKIAFALKSNEELEKKVKNIQDMK